MIITDFKYKNKSICLITISACNNNLDLESPIKKYLLNNNIPESIFILMPNNGIKYQIPKERIPNLSNINIVELYYEKNGTIYLENKTDSIDSNLYSIIVKSIYSFIFKKHSPVLHANHQSYFSLPSGNYATHFIRTANVFTDSEQINILAVFLLPLLNNKPEIIYCDTPSIFPLIYASIVLLNTNNAESYTPRVKSYSSYFIKKDDIENIANSLFLVSTSINGSLPNRLNNFGIDWSKIVVLYSFDKNKDPKYKSICKLERIEFLGKNFQSEKPEDFRNKFPFRTFKIRLEDEQFIPSPPTISSFLLNKNDAPDYLSDFIKKYLKFDYISCYKGKNSKGKIRDLYFDISKLLRELNSKDSNYFETKTNKLLLNLLPINISYIIYIDPFESKHIADLICKYYETVHKKPVTPISIKELYNIPKIESSNSFLVCSSCISEGKVVSNVSRILRFHESSQIIYFNGFLRCNDEISFKNIKSSIQYGTYQFNTHNFINIDKILLPNEDSETISWESEKVFLQKLINGFDEYGVNSIMLEETKLYFQNRLNELSSNEGLVNNVFLNKSDGSRILLNKNFAFFNFSDWVPENVSQAVLYFTILSVIHNYRISNNVKQTVYERFILDPENFNRFNDGIIQAALLRTSSTNELNYLLDDSLSNRMCYLIKNSIEEANNPDSVPYEFLMALCIQKMSLKPEHLNYLYEEFNNHTDNIIAVMINIIHYNSKKTQY
jgi:hypothetical protein